MPRDMPMNLRRLGEWLLFGVLFAVLAFHVVHSAADMLVHSCPATDTVFQQHAAREICPDEQ